MTAFEDLREHIEEWLKQERADGGSTPDFWDECDTTNSLARTLADCGFAKTSSISDDRCVSEACANHLCDDCTDFDGNCCDCNCHLGLKP